MQTIDIEREIKNFLVTTFLFDRAENLGDDQSLMGNVIDSTGVLKLVRFLQERFGITVEDEDVVPENLDSVKSVVAYVTRKLGSQK
jgi:acyl carrier protein